MSITFIFSFHLLTAPLPWQTLSWTPCIYNSINFTFIIFSYVFIKRLKSLDCLCFLQWLLNVLFWNLHDFSVSVFIVCSRWLLNWCSFFIGDGDMFLWWWELNLKAHKYQATSLPLSPMELTFYTLKLYW